MKRKLPFIISDLLVLFLFVYLASGCSTSSFVSNKSDRLKGPYKKIFIAINSDIRAAPFTDPWINNISNELESRDILLKTYVIPDMDRNPLSLQPDVANDEINVQINAFQPEVVLTIALRKIEAYSGVQIGRPGSNGGTFDLKLFEFGDSEAPIWRGNMRVWGDYGISLAVKKGTQTFISKLEEDNIITAKR